MHIRVHSTNQNQSSVAAHNTGKQYQLIANRSGLLPLNTATATATEHCHRLLNTATAY